MLFKIISFNPWLMVNFVLQKKKSQSKNDSLTKNQVQSSTDCHAELLVMVMRLIFRSQFLSGT